MLTKKFVLSLSQKYEIWNTHLIGKKSIDIYRQTRILIIKKLTISLTIEQD